MIDPIASPNAPWLVLAGGLARDLVRHAHEVEVGVVSTPDGFASALATRNPRLIVLESPPATAREVDLVARERRRRIGLRAIFLNAPECAADRLAALEVGFDEALPSSLDPTELVGRLRLLARAASARTAARVPVTGTAELDLVAHELRRDGERVHLRPREYQLLALLATHPRRAYSRQDLIALVWGPAYRGDVRTVDVHVRWLRSKIEADPERPTHLVTVYGIGYRLDPPGTLISR